jgi:hypothetical protein
MSAGLVYGGNKHTDVTPVISSGVAYTINDQVGGLIEITSVGDGTNSSSVTLQSIVVCDKSTQAAALQFFFFDQDPNETSVDNGALSIPDASTGFNNGFVNIASADYQTLALNCVATARNIGLKMSTSTGKLFVLVRTTGTPTYGSTSDLTFRFSFFVDGVKNT